MPTFNEYIEAIKSKVRQPIVKIEFLDENEDAIGIIPQKDFLGGSLNLTNQSGSRRSCDISLKNDEGLYIPIPEHNLWANTKFRLYTGLKVNGEDYFVSRGIFVLSKPEVNSYLSEKTASLTALDKYSLLDGTLAGELEAEYIIDVGTNVVDAVNAVFLEAGEVKSPIIHPTDEVTPYTIIKNPGDTFSAILSDLENMMSWICFFDKNGHPRFQPPTDIDTVGSVWSFTTDEIAYLGSSRRYEYDKIKNHIVVYGDNINGELFRSVAEDTNPESPTRIDLLGKRTKIVNDDLIYSFELAEARAEWELQQVIMLNESVDIRFMPIDIINEDSVILINDSGIGLSGDRYLVQSVSFPLAYDGEQSLSVWKARSFS